MPKKLKNDSVRCKHFLWTIYCRDGVYYADGRSDPARLGRHSLGLKDRTAALTQLHELDHAMAVKLGRAAPSHPLDQSTPLLLDEGRKLYEAHLNRPEVAHGPCKKTRNRYRAVLDKCIPFFKQQGIASWNRVDRRLVEAYLANQKERGIDDGTLYLEGTLIKQVIRFFISEGILPSNAAIKLPLKKNSETTTFCYTGEQFHTMLSHCRSRPDLGWLHDVILGLGLSGLRIGEFVALRWTDVDLSNSMFHITNDPTRGISSSEDRRRTKSRRDRSLPIHPDLAARLKIMARRPHGLVFAGPQGGKLDPDHVRNAIIHHVIEPLSGRFPSGPHMTGFKDGRLHSFRHFFASWAARSGVAERTLMTWLGHRDAKMLARYFHLHDDDSRTQMRKLKIAEDEGGDVACNPPAA